jgi:hypothetical protein
MFKASAIFLLKENRHLHYFLCSFTDKSIMLRAFSLTGSMEYNFCVIVIHQCCKAVSRELLQVKHLSLLAWCDKEDRSLTMSALLGSAPASNKHLIASVKPSCAAAAKGLRKPFTSAPAYQFMHRSQNNETSPSYKLAIHHVIQESRLRILYLNQ